MNGASEGGGIPSRPGLSVALERGVAVVTLDLPGESVNTLSLDLASEFEALLGRLAEDGAVRGVVLESGKPDTFIVGANLDQFLAIRAAEEGTALSRRGQEFIHRLAGYPKPLVAAVHGACLGGGLELILAFDWRVASDHPRTQLGLPEVQVGLVPGAGGCQRLPRLIGLRAALDLILTGRAAPARQAHRLGIVDELVPRSILRETAVRAALRLADKGRSRRGPGPGARGALGWLLDRNPIGRCLVYHRARAQVVRRTRGHYPAPLAALRAVRAGLERGLEAGLRVEREEFGALAVSPVTRQLIGIFFATAALKKDDGVPPGTPSREVRRLGVVGAGFMGAGIAGTAVSVAGVEARLKDTELARVGRGLRAALGVLDGRLRRRRITRHEYERLSALLSGSADWTGFRGTDLVVEAVFEDLAVKRGVLAEIEAAVRSEAVIATNTSTIRIARLAEEMRRPERFLGMHFFSPVERMPLLEVIPGAQTDPAVVATTVRFGRRMGKTVIVVADRPGFWVNRILAPYLGEAGRLLEEGVPVDVIDRAMVAFGFPVGPITLLDEVGLDVAVQAAGVLHEAFGVRLQPASALHTLVGAGRLGRKSGRGIFRYRNGKKAGVDPAALRLLGITPQRGHDPALLQQRLAYLMLNEAAWAVAEGVVRSPRDGDIGAVYGIGFPPFRGGPLRMIDALGADRVARVLEDLAQAFGERFAPCSPLIDMARSGKRFYPDRPSP